MLHKKCVLHLDIDWPWCVVPCDLFSSLIMRNIFASALAPFPMPIVNWSKILGRKWHQWWHIRRANTVEWDEYHEFRWVAHFHGQWSPLLRNHRSIFQRTANDTIDFDIYTCRILHSWNQNGTNRFKFMHSLRKK